MQACTGLEMLALLVLESDHIFGEIDPTLNSPELKQLVLRS
jgi:hypothetical protein